MGFIRQLKGFSVSFWKVVFAVVLGNMLSAVFLSLLSFLFLGGLISVFNHALDDPSFHQSVGKVSNNPGGALVSPVVQRAQQLQQQAIAQAKAQAEANAAKARERQKEIAEYNYQVSAARETCDFWTKQYSKDRSPKSDAYKNMACLRLRDLEKGIPW